MNFVLFFLRLSRVLSIKKWVHYIHHLKCTSDITCEKTTYFYHEAKVFNIQKDKSRIKVGGFTHIRGELLLYAHGGKIQIGHHCYIGENTRIWSAEEIQIGNHVLIAHGVNIHDNISHPLNASERRKHFKHIIEAGHPSSGLDLKEKKVVIEDDAWIGFNASILKGVTIGKRAVVGACAVVTTDVPDDAIVVGNPAKIIGYTHEEANKISN